MIFCEWPKSCVHNAGLNVVGSPPERTRDALFAAIDEAKKNGM